MPLILPPTLIKGIGIEMASNCIIASLFDKLSKILNPRLPYAEENIINGYKFHA